MIRRIYRKLFKKRKRLQVICNNKEPTTTKKAKFKYIPRRLKSGETITVFYV